VPYDQDQECDSRLGICGDILTLYEIQMMLGHKRIDLFKMDIEGHEWPVFESWSELSDTNQASDKVLPMQVLVEIHYQWVELKHEFLAANLVRLQEHLLKMGYAVAARDDNQTCAHCSELTLVRYQCHQISQQ
jgi:heptaprenylglyceryl phosphate synthase